MGGVFTCQQYICSAKMDQGIIRLQRYQKHLAVSKQTISNCFQRQFFETQENLNEDNWE
jgi:hypothetical protein